MTVRRQTVPLSDQWVPQVSTKRNDIPVFLHRCSFALVARKSTIISVRAAMDRGCAYCGGKP